MPTVSVIIPTYNRASMLREAIQSVLDQTYSDFEIIVVDDGSTDNTGDVVSVFSDTRIRYVFQENRGRSNARNHALSLARGEYIAFLDSDDLFLPSKLGIQVKALEDNPDYGMVYSHALRVDNQGRAIAGRRYPRIKLSGRIYPELLYTRGSIITTPSVVMRSAILNEIGGFDERMDICEDLDLWRRVARRHRVLQIEDYLCIVRPGLGRQLSWEASIRARTMYYEKAIAEDPLLEKPFRSKLLSEMFCYYAVAAVLKKNGLMAVRLFTKSVTTNPGTFAASIGSYALRLVCELQFRATRLRRYHVRAELFLGGHR